MTDPNLRPLYEGDWRLIAFDLDDTLAPSKSALPSQMAAALRRLLDVVDVAVISGGALTQFNQQLLTNLGASPQQLQRLHLLPTCGTQYLRFDGGELVEVYDHPLLDAQVQQARTALEEEARRLGLWCEQPWGPVIEDRHSQVTFSALGQDAPLEEKRKWDPTGEKRGRLAEAVASRLPDLEVRSGGSTSLDITAPGVDKAYGMNALVEETGIPRGEMLFFGDRLDEGGNDYAVKAAGWATVAVAGWEETAARVDTLSTRLSTSPR